MGTRGLAAIACAVALLAGCSGKEERLVDATAPPTTAKESATTQAADTTIDGPTATDDPAVLDGDVETFLAEQYFDGSDLDPVRSTLSDIGFDATEQACIASAAADAGWADDVIDISDRDDMDLQAVLDIGADLDSCHPTAVLIASGYEDGADWLPCLRQEVPTTLSFVDAVEVRELGSTSAAYTKVAPVLSAAAQKCIPTPVGTLMARQIVAPAVFAAGTNPLPNAETCVAEGLSTFSWSDFFAVGNRTAGELAPDSMVAVLDRCAPPGTLMSHALIDPNSPSSIVAEIGEGYTVATGTEDCLRTTLDTAGWRAMFEFGGVGSGGLPPAMSKALDSCIPVGAVMAHVLADPASPNSISAAFGDGVQLPDDAEVCLTNALATATWAEISAGESSDGRSVATDALDACVPYGAIAAQALAQQPGAPSTPEAKAAYITCLSQQLSPLSWADTSTLQPDRGPIADAQKTCNAA